jgi:hypothetical protein
MISFARLKWEVLISLDDATGNSLQARLAFLCRLPDYRSPYSLLLTNFDSKIATGCERLIQSTKILDW